MSLLCVVPRTSTSALGSVGVRSQCDAPRAFMVITCRPIRTGGCRGKRIPLLPSVYNRLFRQQSIRMDYDSQINDMKVCEMPGMNNFV